VHPPKSRGEAQNFKSSPKTKGLLRCIKTYVEWYRVGYLPCISPVRGHPLPLCHHSQFTSVEGLAKKSDCACYNLVQTGGMYRACIGERKYEGDERWLSSLWQSCLNPTEDDSAECCCPWGGGWCQPKLLCAITPSTDHRPHVATWYSNKLVWGQNYVISMLHSSCSLLQDSLLVFRLILCSLNINLVIDSDMHLLQNKRIERMFWQSLQTEECVCIR
jgi:hypothetical protein